MKTETGFVAGVNGNLINVDFDGSVRKNEVGYILVEGKRLKVFASELAEGSFDSAENGSVVDTKRFAVKCGDGRAVIFREVQPEGKKRMKTEDFLRGKKLSDGELLG